MNYPASDSAGWRVLLGILIALLFAATVRGQETPDLSPGQHLRVTAAPPAFTGVTEGNLVRCSSNEKAAYAATRVAV